MQLRRAILSKSVEFQSVEANLRHSFRVLAAHRPSGDIRECPGVDIASVGVSFQMFNAAFLSQPVTSEADLRQRIATASVFFGGRGLEWSYWVCEGWFNGKLRQRARQLLRKNLHLASELPGMAAERLLPSVRPLALLDVRRVIDQPTRAAFCDIGAICFNVPAAWFREVFENEKVWKDFVGYVGYVDGEPVSTAATVVACGVVGVYNVATLPSRQRRGYGEAVLRYALDRAREEHRVERTILQSSAQGLRLYERMGYRTVTHVSVYSS
jgi:GNAT superfamily N-acetyltransferase